MNQGRNRDPLCLVEYWKVLVDPRFLDTSYTLVASTRRSRRSLLRRVLGGCAALAMAVSAPNQRAFAQELTEPEPESWHAGEKEVLVSLGEQRLWALEGEHVILTTLVSTGTAESPEVITPLGQWRILVKLPMETMAGTVNGEPYEVVDVPYVMYFTDEGHALHGTYWHNSFGTPMSHGCVNLPMDVAEWMYRWAPEGTAVNVVP